MSDPVGASVQPRGNGWAVHAEFAGGVQQLLAEVESEGEADQLAVRYCFGVAYGFPVVLASRIGDANERRS